MKRYAQYSSEEQKKHSLISEEYLHTVVTATFLNDLASELEGCQEENKRLSEEIDNIYKVMKNFSL